MRLIQTNRKPNENEPQCWSRNACCSVRDSCSGGGGCDSPQVGGWGTLGFRGLDSSKLRDSTWSEATDAFLSPLFIIILTIDVMYSL
jgi:hypothetical protein